MVTRTCRDCGSTFTLSAGARAFFAKHELQLPTRCPGCRAQRRLERNYDRGRRMVDNLPPTAFETRGPLSPREEVEERRRLADATARHIDAQRELAALVERADERERGNAQPAENRP